MKKDITEQCEDCIHEITKIRNPYCADECIKGLATCPFRKSKN